jgi:hypothetical protein
VRFTSSAQDFPLDRFKPKELEALKAEPGLVVTEAEVEVEKAKD